MIDDNGLDGGDGFMVNTYPRTNWIVYIKLKYVHNAVKWFFKLFIQTITINNNLCYYKNAIIILI